LTLLNPPGGRRIILYVPDLMDRSRIEAGRRVVGATAEPLEFVRSPADLAAALLSARSVDSDVGSPEPRATVIVDLGRPGVLEVLGDLAAGGAEVVGFASHVDRDLLRRSRKAGCTTVLARSVFFGKLAELLS
jgi:hypothetical protein